MKLRPINTSHKWLNIPDNELAIYNGIDCLATAQAIPVLLAEAADHRLKDFWDKEVWPLAPAVIAMQRRGMWVDQATRKSYSEGVRRELAEVDAELLEGAPPYLGEATKDAPNSLGSVKKVGKWLFEELGLKSTKRTETGLPSVDQESLLGVWRTLRKKDAIAKVHLENLLHRSRLKTITQRYLDFDVLEDGRVHPTIKMIGTETGRFAYSDPAIQQWPEECRAMISAPPGSVLVGADYEKFEALIAALMFNIKRDLEILQSGEDLHEITAKEVFRITATEWGNLDPHGRKARRNYTKSFRYRIIYGGDINQVGNLGSKVFCPCPRHKHDPVANLEPGTIIEASQRFLSNRPEITHHRYKLLDEVRKTHAVTTPLGRRRLFFGPIDSIKREIFNFPIQSTAADLINRAMRKLHYQGCPLFLQHHDYLGAETPASEARAWSLRIKAAMEAPCAEFSGAVFPVELKFERPWGTPIELSELGA